MILNEQQYRITQDQAQKFEQTLAAMIANPYVDDNIHPILRRAEEAGVRNQLLVLREQIAAYEARHCRESAGATPN
ncbi:MAG: hypothetical protein M3Z04_22160 [Chloroflexota bacterium]|nr:hypothetical protein [Chloroflexota bacterium]